MDPGLLLATGLVVFLAGFAQSVVGFGFALVATPLLVFTGQPLPMIVAVVSTSSMVQAAIGCHNLRADIPWKPSLLAIPVRAIFVVVGVFALREVQGLDPAQIRLVVGLLVVALASLQLWTPEPAGEVPSRLLPSILAFSSSGIINGLAGIGGPPLVLWALARGWSGPRTRAFLFTVFATTIPVQLFCMVWLIGPAVLEWVGFALLLFPFVFLGSMVGLRVGNRLPRRHLRRMAGIVLIVIGSAPILASLL